MRSRRSRWRGLAKAWAYPCLRLLVVLPLAALVLAMLTLGSSVGPGRIAVLAEAVAWGVALTAITELLSLFDGLTLAAVAGAWGLVCLGLLVIGLRARRLWPDWVNASLM